MKPTIMINLSPEIVIFLKILIGIMVVYVFGDIFWQRKKSKEKEAALLKTSNPVPHIPNRKKMERY